MLDSSWGLILRALPSLPLNISNRRLCHFPGRPGSSIARARGHHWEIFLLVSLYSKLAPWVTLDNSPACLAGDAFSDTYLPVAVKLLLHCRHHKGCLASLSATWETRLDFATWNKLLAQTCVLKNCGSWWLKLCSLHMWSVLPVQAFLRYELLQPLTSFPCNSLESWIAIFS